MIKTIEKPYFANREQQDAESHPTNEEIEERAYQLYIERGRADGHDIEDWLRAEQELLVKPSQIGRVVKTAA